MSKVCKTRYIFGFIFNCPIQCTLYNIQYTIYTIHYTVYNIQYTIYNIQYTIYNIQYTIYINTFYAQKVSCQGFNPTCVLVNKQIYTMFTFSKTYYGVNNIFV